MGRERRSLVLSEKEKKTTAIHEAGHALVARLLPDTDPVHKVTIIPRGHALGLTQQLPIEDRMNVDREFALNQIAILMGGRAAEELSLGQRTTGAGNDIEVATDLARKMVCEWGMSDKLGPLAFGKKEQAIFLGREFAQHKDYSEQTAIDIDAEIKRIVTENYERVKKLIQSNLETLKRISEALLEYETLDGHEVDMLMAGKALTRPKPSAASPAVEAKKEAEPSAKTTEKPVIRPTGLSEPNPA
jgi:cell division protease FtsH